MRKNLTEIVFILDRSGSMSGLEADTIGGFNSMIEKQKKAEGEALISTVLFDNTSEVIHDRVSVQNIKPMTDEEKKLVEKAAAKILSKMRNGCTDCRYCQPCPFGVNIPKNFDIWNKCFAYENFENAKKRWAEMDDKEKAKNCVKCGKCEKKCPQKIEIRENLERLQKEMDELE